MNLRVPRLSCEPSEVLASLCKSAGDPLRLQILKALANNSFGVLELTQVFSMPQSGMSHHLKVLAQAGLVATRREGNAIFYRRSLPEGHSSVANVQAALMGAVDDLELPPEVQQRIALVHAQRQAASEDFFARMASHFKTRQDLIAGLPQYRESVLALLDRLALPRTASVLEVGPGDGSFLPDLAQRFAQVWAMDSSPAMLELAKKRCQELQLDNVQLLLGDALQDSSPSADCLILNMVLHHVPAPAKALGILAGRLHSGGSLLVTELCQHQQPWVRETCGDVWLGFEQEDLAHWAKAAGLTPGESVYMGLKNGFQIQVRHFAKACLNN